MRKYDEHISHKVENYRARILKLVSHSCVYHKDNKATYAFEQVWGGFGGESQICKYPQTWYLSTHPSDKRIWNEKIDHIHDNDLSNN